MKNLAKLALLFSLSFAVLFLVAAVFRFLALHVEWVRTLPQKPETILTILIAACHWALSFAVYTSLLLSLGYAARQHYFAPLTIICIFILSLGFSFAISLGLEHWEFVPPAQTGNRSLGEPGLILSNALSRNETAIVLLKGPAEPRGPRVVAIPDQPLIFQAESAVSMESTLPPVPFGNVMPWFYQSIIIDIRLSAEYMQGRFNEGLIPFLIYAGALIFFLSSLGFVLKLSAWPLVNIFIGSLAFRGVLALETFLNSPEMQDAFASFLENRLPMPLVVPLIFCGFGLLVHIYSVLVYAAKIRSDDED